ncbi:hypothetical protein Nos7524_4388 [Nostoc sp. PCC 7524]|uniref:hypothetical protein n=1 Tax=Nostoc sp. (strain ATCC 29411 / PCC 7524) TaxID=28072 RepID=UPI00029F36FF|nr:hypothetical protein [Nostoc sp. PCC 7524]AFY50147.1 hypothetical protein Nos7524_4388 [Nostoc sp. PCC 7524]
MGRWTPLILMAGGLAILMGTMIGINFPMGGQQTANNNAPGNATGTKTSKVLPANINVNSSSPGRNRSNANTSEANTSENNTSETRGNVAQEDFNSTEERGNVTQEDRRSTNRTSVAQNNAPNDSFPESSSDNTIEEQSTDTSSRESNQNRQPIRALW